MISMDLLGDYEAIKYTIVPRLVNIPIFYNDETQKHIVSMSFIGDIGTVLAVGNTFYVTDILLNIWGKDFDTVYAQAIENLKTEIHIMSFDDVINMAVMNGENDVEIDEKCDIQMYCLTTFDYSNAAGILLKDVLNKFIVDHGVEEIMVIPSSIREVILIPVDDHFSYDKKAVMTKIIGEVNSSMLADGTEILSDKPYFYSVKSGWRW